ncbi:MAG: glycosyl transferase family 2 [Acidobacteriales bacterium 59-55]|nr:glycosyltransferase family 2 protein [Terriglobales bacterium]OJV42998.1 MAG: glycosyl transferase family 2 [Acidobacteriales bacterium 59-55]
MLVAPHGLGHYWKTHYADKTFEHLYRWNTFDTCMLIPYFIVMVILAFYGIHRYQLVWLYYRNKKNQAKWDEPPARFAESELPFVTIQLPIFNEQFVVDRLLEAICNLDYPRDRFEIQLLDDSTDETRTVARDLVERYASGAMGMAPQPIVYLHRTDRHGYKAGALDKGLDVAKGELVAIFDADFVPPPQWIMQVVHHFAEPEIGMVQTRWTHLNRNYSFLTQVEAILLDGHFVLEHGGRSRSGVFFNFNGTAGMWRRKTIGEAGGWQHDTLTEDTDLSYRAQLVGWKFKYLQDVECPAELPIEMTAFKTQQARWAKGLIQTAKKILPQVLRSDAGWHTKLEAWYHLTANISYPLMIVLSVLLMPAMIIRSWQGYLQMLLIDFPLFMASTMSVSTFYLVSQKELFPHAWHKKILYVPFLLALGGIGLTITNTKAVMEALFGVKSAFARTPKYRVKQKGEKSQAKVYRKRLGIVPWIELGLGAYFAWTVWYAVSTENFFTVPFLLLFVFGYWYTGLLSLLQGRFERSGNAGQEMHEKPYPIGI